MSRKRLTLLPVAFVLLSGALSGTQKGIVEAAEEPAKGAAPGKLSVDSAPFNEEVLATVDGKVITRSQVDTLIKSRLLNLYEQIYQLRLKSLNRLIDNRLLETEAERSGKTPLELYQAFLSEDEKEASLPEDQSHKLQPDRPPLDQIDAFERSRNLAENRARIRALQKNLDRLRQASEVRIYLRPENLQVNVSIDDDHIRGNPDAPITIIEFADYQCPYCRRSQPILERIVQEYPETVRFVFRDFPVNEDAISTKAALAAECAADQGKFWEYHNLLFSSAAKLDEGTFIQLAREVEIDEPRFADCLSRETYKIEVQKDKLDGLAAGVRGTPTFFVNGRFLSGYQDFDFWKNVIDQILSEKSN